MENVMMYFERGCDVRSTLERSVHVKGVIQAASLASASPYVFMA
jgi:hypothetical protein